MEAYIKNLIDTEMRSNIRATAITPTPNPFKVSFNSMYCIILYEGGFFVKNRI